MRSRAFANLCHGRDAQSLALCRPTGNQRSGERVLPSLDDYAHDALARSLQDRRDRTFVSGAFQIVSDPDQRASADGDEIRRTESCASQLH